MSTYAFTASEIVVMPDVPRTTPCRCHVCPGEIAPGEPMLIWRMTPTSRLFVHHRCAEIQYQFSGRFACRALEEGSAA